MKIASDDSRALTEWQFTAKWSHLATTVAPRKWDELKYLFLTGFPPAVRVDEPINRISNGVESDSPKTIGERGWGGGASFSPSARKYQRDGGRRRRGNCPEINGPPGSEFATCQGHPDEGRLLVPPVLLPWHPPLYRLLFQPPCLPPSIVTPLGTPEYPKTPKPPLLRSLWHPLASLPPPGSLFQPPCLPTPLLTMSPL